MVETSKGAIVSDQKLDLDVDIYRSGMHGGYIVGVCASPALAGGHIYVTDNTGTCLVLEPGPTPRTVARNRIEQTVEPWDADHWDKPHAECTLASPVFEGGRIYVRSELNVYCIGEK